MAEITNFSFGYWREFIKVVVCVVENEGVRTHGYGLAMLGLIALLGLRGQMFTMEDASGPPHPPDPLGNGPRVWANVCDPL